MSSRQRLDKLLVARHLVTSRQQAQALIMAGEVLVEEQRVDKAGALVAPEAAIRLRRKQPAYVSRGGEKLAAALDAFAVPVAQRVVLDVGASTGGFTDCLLQRGAARIYAVDVGYNQLAWQLRQDERVVNLERQHIVNLDPALLTPAPDLAVVDVSFISLGRVLEPLTACLMSPAAGILLIKPQFEVGRQRLGKGGVVRDPQLRQEAVDQVQAQARSLGWQPQGVIPSPILGPKGNQEFLLYMLLPAENTG